MAAELWQHGAAHLAARIAAGEVSSREVVDAHLARIEAVNPAVNAVTRVLVEEATIAAGEADRRRAAGEPLGPLHGVPFTVKENVDCTGSPTTQGVHALAGALPSLDAPGVQRMKAAGAIPLGRTNLPDFAMRMHTDSSLNGPTRNPWDPGRTPGGSSGGEAAALATGMSPIGLGNDLGGSMRWPSQCCGTVCLKPTVGRIPHAYSIEPLDPTPAFQAMSVQGPMARHIRDLRLAFGVLAGRDPRDPKSVDAPLVGPPLAGPRRVAVVDRPPGGDVHPDVVAGVRAAADALADAGYEVVEAMPPRLEETHEVWTRLVVADVHVMFPLLGMVVGEDARRFFELAFELRPPPDLAGLVSAGIDRHAAARLWDAFQLDTPLVLAPVGTHPPFEVGFDLAGHDEVEATIRRLRTTVTVNLVGLPAVAVPVGIADGLPVGVQVIGPRFREDLCLDAAEAIEAAFGVVTPIDPRA